MPFTESLRLEAAARAAGRPVRTAIVGAVGHVEADLRAGLGGPAAALGDLLRVPAHRRGLGRYFGGFRFISCMASRTGW